MADIRGPDSRARSSLRAQRRVDSRRTPIKKSSAFLLKAESPPGRSSYADETYRFLTNPSGFSQAEFAKLSLVRATPFVKSAESSIANGIECLVPRAMTRIALATTCFLACAFYIYVLCQWMRDTNGNRNRRRRIDAIGAEAPESQPSRRLHVVQQRKHCRKTRSLGTKFAKRRDNALSIQGSRPGSE